jgi:hypothetical protein
MGSYGIDWGSVIEEITKINPEFAAKVRKAAANYLWDEEDDDDEIEYWRFSPHKQHSTTTDWKGNSVRPVGTSRRHLLQVTRNCFQFVGPRNMTGV